MGARVAVRAVAEAMGAATAVYGTCAGLRKGGGMTTLEAPPAATMPAPLWSPATRAFDGDRLHLAVIARGWTIDDFAQVTGLHRASVYSALHGRPVRDTTALRIFQALERRRPSLAAE